MIAFLIIFFFLYGSLNFYIGLRGWQSIGMMIPFMNSLAYWIIFWLLALSYIIGRISWDFLPDIIKNSFIYVGSYWMAALLYLTLIILFIDILRLADKWIGFFPQSFKENKNIAFYTGIAVLIVLAVIFISGTINARNPRISYYDIKIPKNGGKFKNLNIALVSDIHLGNVIGNRRLDTMVSMINSLNPDLILLAGDTLDDDISPFIKENMADKLRKLNSKYGVYGVLGNHEYIGGNVNESIKKLEESGIKILKDSYVELEGSIYIVGRDDLSSTRFNGTKRMTLAELTQQIDKTKPIILLDHQPSNLNEAMEQGIDLQLSGHTHRGQLFPNQLITSRIYEIDWGYLKKGDLNVVVSSGFGTWGPPIRIGNRAEIVNINLQFE